MKLDLNLKFQENYNLMDKIKLANQLVKLANNFIALDEVDEGDRSWFKMQHDYEKLKNTNNKIANKERLYKNFSGVIEWGSISGTVKNATFVLTKYQSSLNCIVWYSGTWEDGHFVFGVWEKGIWEKGTFEYSTWENGTWKNGEFLNGVWEDGIWKDGTWKDSVWKNGHWYGGIWDNGYWYDGLCEKGKDKDYNEYGKDDSPDKWKGYVLNK